MPVYQRGASAKLAIVDRWEAGLGWLAHPDEGGRRTSHAVRTRDGDVWLFDPLDAPGLDERLAALGPVAGVAVFTDYHARDAGRLAERHGAPVTVPHWLRRIDDRVDVPVERTAGPIAGFDLRQARPLFAWREAIAYRPWDGTLYVADYLSSHEKFCVGAERVGMPTVSRLRPPRRLFGDLTPERIVFGHGTGRFEDAAGALDDALAGARGRFPRAVVSNLPGELRAMLGAIR